jgi:hypothetical protein
VVPGADRPGVRFSHLPLGLAMRRRGAAGRCASGGRSGHCASRLPLRKRDAAAQAGCRSAEPSLAQPLAEDRELRIARRAFAAARGHRRADLGGGSATSCPANGPTGAAGSK